MGFAEGQKPRLFFLEIHAANPAKGQRIQTGGFQKGGEGVLQSRLRSSSFAAYAQHGDGGDQVQDIPLFPVNGQQRVAALRCG